MQIVPVLDVMNGRVVRGVAGRREQYRPIQSPLAPTPDPLAVARAFRERLGLTTLYVADLDAIQGATPAWTLFAQLCGDGFRLWIDAGVRDLARARLLARPGVTGVVLGLETIPGPQLLEVACREIGEAVIFSLDLRDGRPLGEPSDGGHRDPGSIADTAVAGGVRRILVLDLARVGMGNGIGTEELCARLRQEHPAVNVYAGGGVRGRDDLRRLAACGVSAVLVASALHDGRVTRADIESLAGPPLAGG